MIERLPITLYNVDEDTWGRFRLALLQRDMKVHEGVLQAIQVWLIANPPRISPT